MQILIACAKTMRPASFVDRLQDNHYHQTNGEEVSIPAFEEEAQQAAHGLSALSVDELMTTLRVNRQIAVSNKERFASFLLTSPMPALRAYDGAVFRHIGYVDETYAQQHLWITSFLYGLLRPMDGIRPYRLEGDVRLPEDGGLTRFQYWQPRLTQMLIDSVRTDDGCLVYLASGEMKRLFDWQRVCREVRVIEPSFLVEQEGRMRTIVMYAKMCRGEMTHYLLQHRKASTDCLTAFTYEGFSFAGMDGSRPVYVWHK